MRKIPLHLQIIIGLVAGTLFAFASSALGWSKFTINWIDPFGTIFINLLKLIAVPLVLFSVIKGIAGMSDVSKFGRIGGKTLIAYLFTTITAVTLGLTLVNIIRPGALVDDSTRHSNRLEYEKWVAETEGVELLDDKKISKKSVQRYRPGEKVITAGGMVGTVISVKENSVLIDQGSGVLAEIESSSLRKEGEEKSSYIDQKIEQAHKTKERGPLQFLVDMVPSNIFISLNDNSLMLQVIFFAIFFGLTLLLLPAVTAKPMLDFVDSANEVFLKMVEVVMKGAPFFVFALLAGVISKLAGDDPGKVVQIFKGLSWYSVTVVLALAIMAFLFYPLVIRVFAKRMTFMNFLRGISPAQLLAFSTSSSAATLPVTIECVNENLKVNKEISSFVLPVGATVNMDGTSLYQAIAVVFLAQFHMVDLTLGQQLTIVLTATLASIGSAAVPSAGLIMLIIVLESVGLNPAWIAIIFPVDRILDMCRTVVNVTGDATVSTVIASTEGKLGYHEE